MKAQANFTGQFMRVLYHRICEQRMPRWAYTFAEYHHRLCCLNWNKKKRCRWRFRPNFVPSKAVVLLLLIHSLMFPIGLWGRSVWASFCYALLSVLSRFAIILKRKREHDALLYCLSTISVLWLFLTVPWIGLKYVIVIIPDHTCLHFNGSVHQSLILIT